MEHTQSGVRNTGSDQRGKAINTRVNVVHDEDDKKLKLGISFMGERVWDEEQFDELLMNYVPKNHMRVLLPHAEVVAVVDSEGNLIGVEVKLGVSREDIKYQAVGS